MKTATLFSWGYWGWGTATRQLVELMDSIEEARGFRPPLFVDVRLRREVRAPGFNGSSFEKLLGRERYVWMKSLGNRCIGTDEQGIVIDKPETAVELLDLALGAAEKKQRVIFFCSCQWPKSDGEIECHRVHVSELVLAAAAKKGISVDVVEWPGGQSQVLQIDVSASVFAKINSGQKYIPLPGALTPTSIEGPAWATLTKFVCGEQSVERLVGHAIWRDAKWQLPVVFWDSEFTTKDYKDQAAQMLVSEGWIKRGSGES